MKRDSSILGEAEKTLANIDSSSDGKNPPGFIDLVPGYEYFRPDDGKDETVD